MNQNERIYADLPVWYKLHQGKITTVLHAKQYNISTYYSSYFSFSSESKFIFSFITYCGELFILMYILPMYSPIIPSISIISPPINSITDIIELQPTLMFGINSFLKIVIIPKIKPTIAQKTPTKEDILRGLIRRL